MHQLPRVEQEADRRAGQRQGKWQHQGEGSLPRPRERGQAGRGPPADYPGPQEENSQALAPIRSHYLRKFSKINEMDAQNGFFLC